MKKKLVLLLLLVGSLSIGFAAIADLTGKWTGMVNAPDGNQYPLTYTFKTDGSKVTGTAESPLGTSNIENGKINGSEFSFSVNMNGMDVQHKGKYYTDSVTLDITYDNTPIHATLKRTAQ